MSTTSAPYSGRFTPTGAKTQYLAEVRRHRKALAWALPNATPFNTIIALDIDGTIVNIDQCFSEHIVDMVDVLRAAGVQVCITTGRSVPATVPVAAGLGLTDSWLVSANGAMIGHWTSTDGYQLHTKFTFDARRIVTRLLERLPQACIGVEDDTRGFWVNRPFPEGELHEVLGVAPLPDLLSHPVTRVVVRVPNLRNRELRAALEGMDFAGVEHAMGWRSWLDLNPPGTSKATGLATVCTALGTAPTYTVAIGDGENDIPILEYASYGVAMGNASDLIKIAANNHTLSVEQDGATAVLEALAQHLGLG